MFLVEIYKAMRLNQYGGVASKWAWALEQRGVFQKRLHVLGSDHLVHGNMTEGVASMAPEKCCVDMSAVSLAGLILLCARWSAAEPQHGGFQDHGHSQAARALAASLIDVALEATCGVRTMRVVFDADWECRRPRPDAIALSGRVIEFEVEGNRVPLPPWRSEYENKRRQHGSHFARLVWDKACMSCMRTLLHILRLCVNDHLGGD